MELGDQVQLTSSLLHNSFDEEDSVPPPEKSPVGPLETDWEDLEIEATDVIRAGWLLLGVYTIILVSLAVKTVEGEVFYVFDYNKPRTKAAAYIQVVTGLCVILLAYFGIKAHRWIPNKPTVLWLPLMGLLVVDLLSSYTSSNNVLEAGVSISTYFSLYLLWHAPFELELPRHDTQMVGPHTFRQLCGLLHLVSLCWILFLDASREYGKHSEKEALPLYLGSLCEELVLFDLLHLAFRNLKSATPPLFMRANSLALDNSLDHDSYSLEKRRAQRIFGAGLLIVYLSEIVSLLLRWELSWDARYTVVGKRVEPFRPGFLFDYRDIRVLSVGRLQLALNILAFSMAIGTFWKKWKKTFTPLSWTFRHMYEFGLFLLMFGLLLCVELMIALWGFKPGAWLQLAINLFGYLALLVCWIGGTTAPLTKLCRILQLMFLAMVVAFGAKAFLSHSHHLFLKRQQALLFLNFIFEQMLVFELLHKAEHID
eukprot:gb/GEZN01005860.1/.p1 GENE.gb/GEZN01005860.1/~~gb/GEZN01005860.1/.p1  ORF type:complete len:482 (+),score=51.67 gb/GEZN01005860.1/:18-1463(+)